MPGKLLEVNIKEDMPTAASAIKRVTFHLSRSKALGYSAVKIIHGYGSSGKGGKIRTETRAYLQRQKNARVIKDFIPGEQFSIFDEATRNAFAVCGDLRRDSDLERSNNGITIVVL
ncbi:MAG: hypothetical protein VB064_11295 [Oscillospiraceae bacterium]|nr:hypothetical protein [Oscillospiraceae bacterium]